MKKTLTLVTMLALSLFSVNAYAQHHAEYDGEDNYLFNHWSVGVGILEDIHFQVAGTITPNLQVRLVYNTLHPYISIADNIVQKHTELNGINPLHETFDLGDGIHTNGINIDKIDFTGSFKSRELNLLVDYFPSKKSSFHVTGGLILDLTPNMFAGTGTPLSNDGQPALQPSDYGTKEFIGITTDLEGKVNGKVCYGLSTVRPYVGIGFGRAVNTNKRVTVGLDLGVAYTGGLHAYAENYMVDYPNKIDVELNEEWTINNEINGKTIKEHMGKDADKYIKYVNFANKFPILPYLRFTINCRLF